MCSQRQYDHAEMYNMQALKNAQSTSVDTARLRAARERLSLAQIQASKELGVSKGTYGAWERGEKQPALENLVAICRLFDVSADWLLRLEPRSALPGSIATGAARHQPGTGQAPRTRTGAGPTSPDEILADEDYPHGLRALADSRSHHLALRVAPHEWAALASLDLPGGLTRDGYIGVLMLLRSAAMQHSYAHTAGLGTGDPAAPGTHDHVSEGPATVHEPPRPKYPQR